MCAMPEDRPGLGNAQTLREMVDQLGLTLTPAHAPTMPAAADRPTPGGPSLGRYPATGHLGEGGMGEVQQVRDGDIGRASLPLDGQCHDV